MLHPIEGFKNPLTLAAGNAWAFVLNYDDGSSRRACQGDNRLLPVFDGILDKI
jgi:hypothetical protein